MRAEGERVNPLPTNHPPSLKNPIPVKQALSTRGWYPGASRAEREEAVLALIEAINRAKRQTGKPAVAQTAQVPVWPILEK